MKFTASNQAWIRGISAVQNAVGSPISNPIVENIYVSCENGKTIFIATNLNLSIRCEIEANVIEPGQVVVPSDVITRIVRDFPEGDVEFSAEKNLIRITGGEFKVRINGHNANDFPSFAFVNEKVSFPIAVNVLKEAISKTVFATTHEKTRFELDGVCFDVRDKKLNCVSTDGRRLAWFVIEDKEFNVENIAVLIPAKTLQEVNNSLPNEGEALVKLEDKRIEISCADVVVVSNLLNYNFPQYEKIVPMDSKFSATVKKELLSHAVKRASNLADKNTHMIVMKVENNQIETNAERTEIGGEGRDMIVAEYKGDVIENRYNYNFLVDFIRSIEDDEIEIELWESAKPAIFRPKGKNYYKYLIMPMKPPEN